LDLYQWIVYAHILAVILSLMAHGVSAFAMFRLRSERDSARLAAILDLSGGTLMISSIGLLVAIVLGIIAAIAGGHFGKFWPWASIAVVVVIIGSMTPLAGTPLNRVRKALGMKVYGDKPTDPPRQPGTSEELAAALAGIRPELPAAIGVGGIAILAWLMRAKPF
jgi:ABC-type amino acid transport system permease subunit